MYTREDYARLETRQLRRQLRETEERAARADTMQAALTDLYAIQEITAALLERGQSLD